MSSVSHLTDHDLLAAVTRAAQTERRSTAELIVLLMELDARKLYLVDGYSSLFTYCTQALHLSGHAAYGRIEAARAARRFPMIPERLAEGTLTLTAVGLLAPHLTPENHLEVLEAARHRSKRDVEHLVARLRPQPDAPAEVRKLPTPRSLPVPSMPAAREQAVVGHRSLEPLPDDAKNIAAAPIPRGEVRPLTPERYKIQFTVGPQTYEQLRRAQDLLRHSIPTGDPGAIFAKALTVLLKELCKVKHGEVDRPRSNSKFARRSRHIAAAIKRAVWQRDGGRCAFMGAQARCVETGFLEFHHVVPYAAGGETSIANLELRCRAHNAYEAERDFGKWPPPNAREERARYLTDTRLGPDRVAD